MFCLVIKLQQVLRFSHWCIWRFWSSGMLHCVCGKSCS